MSLLLVGCAGAWGLESDREQPMELAADSLSIDESKGVSLYEGHVEITQGSFRMWADRVWIYRHQGKTEKIISEGTPTRFQQLLEIDGELVKGQALRMEIELGRNELLMIDQARLEQAGNQFGNDRILYNRGSAQVKAGSSAQGKERVQVVIEPQVKREAP
ncbi:MAG: lipopolysaccharide transport periplasmic protein LptA [Candidatus Thiodiazotropha sp.]